jgi:oligopeptide/dipeptide ABC transporter ATP-binding protein
MSEHLIQVRNLSMDFVRKRGFLGRSNRVVRALDGVDLDIMSGETLGIVGESGCGKSTLARCLLRLLKPTAGSILFDSTDLLELNGEAMRQMRQQMQIVLQNPFASLNPRLKVFDLVAEPLRTHMAMPRQELVEKVEALLFEVGLTSEFMDRYPHQVSGGQAQRIALARALSLNPRFLILDEPTSALDVSVQAQIINLLLRLQQQRGLTYLFITHDLSIVQHIGDRIAVMYLGKVVELASSETIFENAVHPYTQALLSSTPVPDPEAKPERIILSGNVPSAANPPAGCAFHPRCPQVMDICRTDYPSLNMVSAQHQAHCHLLTTQQKGE